MTQIAKLVIDGKLVRHDGPYELHYPHIKHKFVRRVQKRVFELTHQKKKRKKR